MIDKLNKEWYQQNINPPPRERKGRYWHNSVPTKAKRNSWQYSTHFRNSTKNICIWGIFLQDKGCSFCSDLYSLTTNQYVVKYVCPLHCISYQTSLYISEKLQKMYNTSYSTKTSPCTPHTPPQFVLSVENHYILNTATKYGNLYLYRYILSLVIIYFIRALLAYVKTGNISTQGFWDECTYSYTSSSNP